MDDDTSKKNKKETLSKESKKSSKKNLALPPLPNEISQTIDEKSIKSRTKKPSEFS